MARQKADHGADVGPAFNQGAQVYLLNKVMHFELGGRRATFAIQLLRVALTGEFPSVGAYL